MNLVHIIGIGQGKSDLTARHLEIIRSADLLVGGKRHLDYFPEYSGETLAVRADIESIVKRIQREMDTKKIVVLASGDPLFYGIGATLARSIPGERLKVHPNVTSVGAAFATICQPWHDARIISLHSRTGQALSFPSLAVETKLAFLTGPERGPGYIARQLIDHDLDGFSVCVLERLGQDSEEHITWFTDYKKILDRDFAQPNIVILLKSDLEPPIVPHETHIGMPDNFFRHSKGLITKSEVRSISLSRLRLARKDHILWDIGSGSGSVGIEAALQLPWGQVFAVEKNESRIPDIIHNIRNFNLPNVKVAQLNFPKGHDTLKTPDRIFIGGGGKNLETIISCCCDRIARGGTIVINTVIIESMDTAVKALDAHGFTPQVIQVQVSRSKLMPYGSRLNALNPVWIISGTKPETHKVELQ